MSTGTAHRESSPRHGDPGRESRGVLRALAALGALGVLVVGVPVVLVGLSGALPLDLGALAPSAWAHADDGHLLLLMIVAVAWSAWVMLGLSVAVETWATLRQVQTPRLPGLAVPQRMAAALVAAVLVALSPLVGSGSSAVAVGVAMGGAAGTAPTEPAGSMHSTAAAVLRPGIGPAEAARTDPTRAGDVTRGEHSPPQGSSTSRDDLYATGRQPAGPTVTTQRHDTLWLLAETHLGSGERFAEIVELNRDVVQPDGRTLGEGGRVYPGWTLVLPADARVSADRTDRHLVVSGDTLWEIAGDEWGDPTRYPEIAEANRGDRQPDGRHLEDPDLILPGWVLELPAQGTAAGASAGSALPDAAALAAAPDATASAPTGDMPGDRAAGPGEAAAGDRATSAITDAIGRVSPLPSGSAAASTPSGEPTSAAASAPSEPEPLSAPAADSAGSGIPLPAGGALSALLLAGVAAELVRRRRQFQRHRLPGERMPMPTTGAQEVERAARAAAHEPGLELLDRALAELGEQASLAGIPIPDVWTVRVSPTTVVLHLASPAEAAIAPFTTDHGTRWVLDSGRLTGESPDRPRALPGLVTLGFMGDETVLLNLDSVGTLAVTGEPAVVAEVLRGLAAELALGPVSALSERLLCVTDPSIQGAVEAGAIAVESAPERARAAIVEKMRSAAAGSAQADPLLIVLCDQDLDIEVPASSGCALITTAPHAAAGATLAVQGPGDVVLLPTGEKLVPQSLGRRATQDIVGILGATDVPDSDSPGAAEPAPAPDQPDQPDQPEPPDGRAGHPSLPGTAPTPPQPVIDLREGTLRSDAAAERSQPTVRLSTDTAPRILLLGEIRVEDAHGKTESSRIGRLAETAAFVHLNPGSRQSDLQGALWPARRSNPQTCRQMISRTRTWLGRTDAGEPYLMNFADTGNRLRLRPEVTSDWADFQRLAAVGLADPTDTGHLHDALALVRGRPFGAVASRELPWADLHINEMIGMITDVAHALAVRHELAGSLSAACAAALRGLQTDSGSEVLEAIVARTSR